MARRIIINGEDLDLYHDEKISFNLRVNSLADISNRNSSSSNSILIPRTGKNQRLLGMTGTMGNTSDVPYSSQRCDYIIQGTYIVVQGFLQVIETLPNDYRIAIYDGIIDFAELLGNKTIADLDFSPENHILDFATFEASLGNTEGYIYAMADYNKTEDDTNEVSTIAPSIFAHTVWDRIFTEAGLQYTGGFFATTDWKELVLPATVGQTIAESTASETDIGNSDSDVISDNTNYGTYIVKNYQHEYTVDGFDANAILTSGDIEMVYTGTANFNYSIDYTLVGATRVRWQIKLNGGVKKTIDLPEESTGTETGSVTIEVSSGDIISVHLSVDTRTPSYPFDPATFFTHNFNTDTNIQIDTVSGGTLIEVGNYMSTELKQKDFVKDILQRYGLIMIRERDNPNEYRFIEMEGLLEDRTNNRDWTDKLGQIKEKYQSGYAQNNLADYSYASGVVPYLTGTLVVANSNAKFEQTIITAPYEIPEESLVKINNVTRYKIPIWKWDEDDMAYANVETAPRLMRLKYDSNDAAFKLFGSANTTVSVDIPFLSLDNMSYQYFFDNYYGNFKTLLDSYKEINITLNLNIVDFKQIDFGQLIYFRQTGRYYYIDTVKLQENGATAKLIEIRNFNA